jgi:formylglycine-generating enzyme required for sulfatase activity
VGFALHAGVKLPDIAWGGLVPAGRYTIGDDALPVVSIDLPFQLAQYPVTVAQFDCFAQAADVDDERWWVGMPDDRKYRPQILESRWTEANRPRETVSWYQAVAFCRWLDHHYRAVGWIEQEAEIVLPHEYEWEVAARYAGDGQTDRRAYPWGSDEISAEYANYNETSVGQTTAVGIFPMGRQPVLGLYDLSGNVWEWCRNKYDNPKDEQVDHSGASRTLRGGSWYNTSNGCRAAYRYRNYPYNRDTGNGFRVCVRRPPSHDR